MTLHVFRSNRSEILADALAAAVARPADPMQAEHVVVGSRGMERWLQQALAEKNGVAAHLKFPFPGAFVHEVLDAVLSDRDAAALWRPEALALTLGAELAALSADPRLGALGEYLRTDGDEGVRRVQLAEELARLFDRYALFRPEQVRGWDDGADPDEPQAFLWRRVCARLGPHHLAARLDRLRVTSPADLRRALPGRVHLFQPTGTPPQLLAAFARFSEFAAVSLYVLSPADGWWADTRSIRQRLLEAERAGAPTPAPDGPLLLAELGSSGRDFQWILEDHAYTDVPLYEDPGRETLLRRLQRELWENQAPAAKEALDPDDPSLELHVASTPTRELEVLRDRLITAFEADPTLSPEDVVVAMPDLDAYAGAIHAVFGSPDGRGAPPIPFRVADRSRRAEGEVLDALERALALLPTRFSATDVLELIALPAVRDRLHLSTDDVDRIAEHVEHAQVRWGLDAAHRAAEGLPALDENTWRFGVRRMLVGYAAPGAPLRGVAPLDEVEGLEAEAVGGLAELIALLADLRDEATRPRPLAAWCDRLGQFASALADDRGDRAGELRAIREALTRLGRLAEAAQVTDPLSFDAALVPIRARLNDTGAARGFLAGGVTFCGLEPLRAIPFRVVAVLGLDAERFPRGGTQRALDLTRAHRRRGDRDPREDDRYLFLETLLSARDALWLSHVGRDPQEPRERPASAVVHAVIEAVAAGHFPSGTPDVDLDAVRQALTRKHPLQPFDPPAGHPSWSPAWTAAARSRSAAPLDPAPFAAGGLGYLPHDALLLDQIRDFCRSPARFYLRQVLEISLPDAEGARATREPLTLDRGALSRAVEPLIDLAVREGLDAAALWARIRATGTLPAGRAGEMLFADFRPTLEALIDGVRQARGDHPAAHHTVDVRVRLGARDVRVVGRVEGLFGDRLVSVTPYTLSAARQLRAWVDHVAAHAAGRPVETWAIGRSPGTSRPAVLIFRSIPDGLGPLRNLAGMAARCFDQPIPLFPDASLAWVEGAHRKPRDRWKAAAELWEGRQRNARGQTGPPDRWVALAWRGHLPVREGAPSPFAGGHDFPSAASFAFGPLVAAREWRDLA